MSAIPLIGHRGAEARFLAARSSGRLHHGWILQGPSGIGKSRFTKRLAALMLGAESPDADADDKVMQLVLSGGHPDMKWLKRDLNDKGKLRQDITVEQVREMNQFFALRPAMSGWRVGVVDALDDLNVSGMNALLKTLEEPPRNSILFLISHGQQPILPTIRSRCQMLRLYPLSDEETKAVLATQAGASQLAFDLAHGRPGHGLQLAETGGAAAVQTAQALLRSLRKPSAGVVAAALTAAISDEGALQAFTDTVLSWVAKKAESEPRLSKTWLDLHAVRSTALELNLTPAQTATKLFAILQRDVKAVSA